MADVETIAAFTEVGADRAPDEQVSFINISETGPDNVLIMMRGRDGRFIELGLTAEEWDDFRSDVIDNG